MIIRSDWHIHSSASYDSRLPIEEIIENSRKFGFIKFGITDHVNLNEESYSQNLLDSVEVVKKARALGANAVLGVELTPIEKPLYDYLAKNGSQDGYVAPSIGTPYGIELGKTKEELLALGVRYVIGASHWRTDIPGAKRMDTELTPSVNEWYRQQLWLSCDERVTVLGHPWYNGKHLWYEDFDVIPKSMKENIAAALLENKKYVECNSHFFIHPSASEKFRHQYAEYIRWMFEMGIPVTYGSDSHNTYTDVHVPTEKYLSEVGFVEGEISEIDENHLW